MKTFLSAWLETVIGRLPLIAAALGCVFLIVPLLVVTRSEKGAIAVANGERVAVGAEPIETVVDTTGAGDCFVGTLAARLGSGTGLADALETANAAAALSVQKPGAAPSMPRAEDVRAFLAGRSAS